MRWGPARHRPPGVVAVAGAVALAGGACSTTVASDLEQRQAEAQAAYLRERGVRATAVEATAIPMAGSAARPRLERRWQVDVPSAESDRAAHALRALDVAARVAPRPVASSSLLDALAPSRLDAHQRSVTATGRQLEHTLASMEGVLAARVHLAVPLPPLLASQSTQPATASVLLRHLPDARLPARAALRQLVAGAVTGLDPNHVSVLLAVAAAAPAATPPERRSTLPPASLRAVRVVAALALAANAALAVAVLLLWRRLRRTQLAPQDAPFAPRTEQGGGTA